MKGHIRQRSKGSWEVVIDIGVDPVNGHRRQHFETIRGAKRDAQRRLHELLSHIEKGIFIKPSRLTVGELLETWLCDYAKPNTASRTYERCEEIVRLHLVPALGSFPLLALRPEHIQKYYAKAVESGRRNGKGGLSTLTVLKHHRVLFEALRYGVKHEIISRNVAEAVDPPRALVKEMQVWNAHEIDRFLVIAKSTPYYYLFHLDLFSGLRRSEILGLKWVDMDFMFGQLSVNRTLHQKKDGSYEFRPPKTIKGKRKVSLTPRSLSVMQDYYEEQKSYMLI